MNGVYFFNGVNTGTEDFSYNLGRSVLEDSPLWVTCKLFWLDVM